MCGNKEQGRSYHSIDKLGFPEFKPHLPDGHLWICDTCASNNAYKENRSTFIKIKLNGDTSWYHSCGCGG